jgi:hypothetical protein
MVYIVEGIILESPLTSKAAPKATAVVPNLSEPMLHNGNFGRQIKVM